MAATTTPDGIIYPTLSDQGDDIPAVLATMAGSIQTALTNLRTSINARVASPVLFGTASGTKPRARYWKMDNIVYLSGVLAKGTGYTLFTLPVGFRPPGDVTLTDGTNVIVVRAAGGLEYSNSNAMDVAFNHFFPVT